MSRRVAPQSPPAPKRVALFYPLRPGNAQDFLRGIFRYARPAKTWEFCLAFGWDAARLQSWRPDGVIGHVLSAEAASIFEHSAVPVVETAFDYTELPVPRVGLDDRAIGAAGAEHLLDHGFARFVYLGDDGKAYSRRRWEGFEARLRESGRAAIDATGMLGAQWHEALPPVSLEARRWLLGFERPLAAFVAHDMLGLELLEVARSAGLRVPEDLAVLGVSNVEWICSLAYPTLSSIRTAAETAGHEAARLLDSLMDGGAAPAGRIEFPPLGVVTRRSTDIYAVTDADLARALRFIGENAQRPISVDDVVEAACTSRSTLERRFRAVLGRAPLDEILRVRIERARQLLVETDLPITEVARQAGFHDGRHLAEAFRARAGQTPTAYRERFRAV